MEKILCPRWIRFAPSEETIQHYYKKFKIPGVIGCVDGSHIYLLKPNIDEHVFFNRKGTHSINAMMVIINF